MAAEKLQQWGDQLIFTHDIQEIKGNEPSDALPANEVEARLGRMLTRAGFPNPVRQHQIRLGQPLNSTTPDCFWPGDDEDIPGVCIYLDGLSDHIHGNPATYRRDQAIRTELRSRNYEVIEITASELFDRSAMERRFYKLGRCLLDREQAKQIKDNPGWFDRGD